MIFLDKILKKILPYTEIVKIIDGKPVVYMQRFFLWRNRNGNKYLHHFLRSDDDPDPHNHPYDFTSIILSGGYIDEWYVYDNHRNPKLEGPRHYKVKKWTIQRRMANHTHRVHLIGNKKPWTLVFTGPLIQPWGFVKPDGTWIYWKKYLKEQKQPITPNVN